MQKLDAVTEKVQSTNEEFENARKKAKKAKAAFERVKNERSSRFVACCQHISDAIDGIYKKLARNEAAQAYIGPDNPEEDISKARKDVANLAKEIHNVGSHLSSVESKIEAKKNERQNILLQAKVSCRYSALKP